MAGLLGSVTMVAVPDSLVAVARDPTRARAIMMRRCWPADISPTSLFARGRASTSARAAWACSRMRGVTTRLGQRVEDEKKPVRTASRPVVVRVGLPGRSGETRPMRRRRRVRSQRSLPKMLTFGWIPEGGWTRG